MLTAQHGGGTPISTLVPYAGWVLALALLIWIAQKFFGSFFTELGTRFATFFLRLFGSHALSKRTLKRYRRAIRDNYGEHALGFRREGTVKVKQVYVPLQYIDQGHRRDVAEAINRTDRAVVVGEPGAGKSLLMKHILVTWADSSTRETQKIPVLVELHRCNTIDVSLMSLIQGEFERNGVRGMRESVIEHALDAGRLFVLFDGLDEVTRDNQTRVVNLIKDFATKWGNCKYVTTCRIAVYTGQLLPQFSSTVAISEFDDAGIRRLLANWPTLDAAEADRFFAGLAESPQLMRLAGSPLLLTMMVYLHSEVFAKTGRTLPSSRPAFYEVAVDHLLRRDRELARDDALSIYEGADKRAALQRVALTLQQTPQDQPDRRAIDRIQLMDTVKQVATNLNLREQDVAPLIKEIVDRSQLLVELDQQSFRYIFRHLTLQEFLAASELRNNPTLLMEGYSTDHDGWRETVRLWCGVTSLDCTDVVKEIFNGSAQEKVLALQCVAEATSIAPGFAEEVITYFIDLVSSAATDRAIESALGAVASDDRPRGQSVLARLGELFISDRPGHAGAARALAATRRPGAAWTLGKRILDDDAARSALRTMGEQAVPVLQAAAAGGDLRSVDDLGEIATASAADALITLIGNESDIAFRAAWWTAALISRPEVADGLQTAKPTVLSAVPLFDWVWEPFADLALKPSMGRVAWLLAHDAADHSPASLPVIDPRLGIAVMISDDAKKNSTAMTTIQHGYGLQRDMFISAARRANDALSRVTGDTSTSYHDLGQTFLNASRLDPSETASVLASMLAELRISKQIQHVFSRLPTIAQYVIIDDEMSFIWRPQDSNVRQWVESTKESRQPKLLSGIAGTILVTTILAIIGAAIYQAIVSWFGVTVGGIWWLNTSARFALGVLVGAIPVILLADLDASGYWFPVRQLIRISEFLADSIAGPILTVTALLVCLATIGAAFYDYAGWKVMAATIGSLVVVSAVLYFVIERREKRFFNPFRKYVTLSSDELEKYMERKMRPY